MESLVALPSLSIPELLSRIKEAFTCGGVGLVVGTAVYGITLFQAYIYFHNSGQDSIRMKSFVALLFILDTISLILAVDACYEYVVTDFGNSLLLLNIPLSLALENAFTASIRVLTQCFLAHRVWALSNGNITLVGSIIVFALGSLVPSIVMSADIYSDNYIFSLGSIKCRILTGVADGLSVLCDVLIVAALSYYLHSKRTGFKRTNSMIDRLIIYAVNRGVLTTICQAGHLIAYVALPGRFIFLAFALLEGKLYTNTFLATLNAQKAMRNEGGNDVVELGTHVLNHVSTSTAGNGTVVFRYATATSRPFESIGDSASAFVLDISAEKLRSEVRSPLSRVTTILLIPLLKGCNTEVWIRQVQSKT
ncbi:hypothetical protein GSI_02676 [Ganoderma sinense ZZ0214-1]|uniref:DUF6534 domain-containing protein n=1 Tax=Ganoderma sinense ZZ0214-1 TaxID=1077348 RepID=A0A2G8SMB8_9APHY|nr:hypothetical protein GSI_02676 [Ganoderma sinense ZZ0214-1]